jgi:hypothetical protein
MAIKFLSDISLQKGQIKDVSLERLASDPTGSDAFEGRIYYNTGDDTVRYRTGSAFVTLATGSGYSNWVLSAGGATGVDVDSGNTVDFAAGTGLTVGRSDKTITYTLSAATSSVRGGIELFSDTAQAVAANSVSATDNRTYGIQLNSAGQAVVNVPWTDTSTGSFTLTADSGTNQTIASGDTMDIAGGTGITTVVSATDTVTVTNSKPFDSLTLASTSGSDSTISNSGTITIAAGSGITTTNNGSGQVTIAATGSGTMSSFNAAGDSGDAQEIGNGDTLSLVGATNGGIVTAAADTDEVNFAMDVADLTATTTWTSTADYFAVSDGAVTRKILSSNIPVNDFAAADGNLSMGNNKITNLATPTANADAATKLYVDNAVTGGLEFKGSFNATTGAISGGGNLTSGGSRVAVEVGDLYIVSTAGNFFGNAATPLTIGDSVYCQTAAIEGESAESDFAVVQSDTDLATASSVGLASFPTAGGLVVSAGAVSLKDQSGVTAAAYGGAAKSLNVTVDEHGIITALTENDIAIAASAVSGLNTAIDNRIATHGNAATGDSSTGTSITFAHGLDSTDLLVQLYDISGASEELVYADIAVTSTNIVVTFGASQTLSNYRVVAMKVT